jgi:2-dehydropantoate 2-reductase
MKPAEIYAHPRLFELEMRQLKEALAVMAELGAPVTNLPGTPVVPLSLIARYLPPGLARLILGRALAGGRGDKMPSFHVDLHGGASKTEAPHLQGAVVRFGERLGVPTPVNRLLVETVNGLFEKRIALNKYARQPEKFLRAVGSR